MLLPSCSCAEMGSWVKESSGILVAFLGSLAEGINAPSCGMDLHLPLFSAVAWFLATTPTHLGKGVFFNFILQLQITFCFYKNTPEPTLASRE